MPVVVVVVGGLVDWGGVERSNPTGPAAILWYYSLAAWSPILAKQSGMGID